MAEKFTTLFCRTVDGEEYELQLECTIDHIYRGSEAVDDPSECAIMETVTVLETNGPFTEGQELILTEDERHEIEEAYLDEIRQEEQE